MGLLDGGISALFGTVFSGLFLPATLTRVAVTNDGEGGASVAEDSQPCSAQVDSVTEAMRQAPGYTTKDVRLIVLQSGVTGGQIDTDCKVTMNAGAYAGTTFKLSAPITVDPASSYWECRATPA